MPTVIAKHRNINRNILTPPLRFQGFSDDWSEVKFSDLFSFFPTNSFSRAALNYDEGQIKNIHYGDIHTKYRNRFYINKEIVPYVESEIDLSKVSEESYCRVGDIVIADASEDYPDIGKSIEIIDIDNQKLVAGLHTLLARPKSNTFALGFLSYLMRAQTIRLQIMMLAQGTKVLGISAKYLDELIFRIPSLAEQQKISSLLSSADDWIENLQLQKEAIETFKKALMQKIFLKEISFKDENGKQFPEWETVTIGNHTKIYDGTHQTPTYVNKGIPFYSVEHLTSNNFEEVKFISSEVYEREINRVTIEKGDILMTRIGDIGTARLIDWNVKASFYVSLALIKCNSSLNSEFLAHYIATHHFQKELWKRTIHAAFPKKINLGEIGECKILLPCLKEQIKIANFLSSFDILINLKKENISIAKMWKKGLMQKMFI